MTPDNDWTELSDAWTAPASDDQALADLARQVRRRGRLGALNFYAEMAGCLLAAVVGGWVLATRPAEQWVLGSAAVIFGLFSAAVTLWARGARPPDELETPQQALTAAIRQAEAGRRWSQAGIAVTIGAAVFLGTAAATMGAAEASLVVLYGAAVVFLLGALAFCLRHQDRCVRRIAAHQAAFDDLTGG